MKKYKKIVLAGGNGYLGGILAEYYKHVSEEVVILSRKYKAPPIMSAPWFGMVALKMTGVTF